MTQLEKEIRKKSVKQLVEIADGSCGYSDDTRLFALITLILRQNKEIEKLKDEVAILKVTAGIR